MTRADERAARLEQAIRLKRAAARPGAGELPPRPADRPALLSEVQRSLWLLHELDPASPAYNLASAFGVRGPLDVEQLRRALGEVVARHRLLRSSFRFEHGAVRQVIEPPAAMPVEVIEVPRGQAMAAAVEEARKPFDLATAPLLRLRLIEETGAGERLLLLVLHHILADERSLGIFWAELAEAYGGRLLETPAPALQYDDHAHWSAGHEPQRRRAEIDFWRHRLDPPPEPLRLPFESPPAEGGSGHGRLEIRASRAEVLEGVRGLAAAAGVTPFTVFAFAFRLLLDRYTGGERVAFATPVSTRSHPATAGMIGYFLNPVVLSTPVDEERGVAEAVREFSRQLREDLAHAAVPFQVLAEELSPPRQPDRHPLFQAMFVHQEAAPPPALGAARLEPVTLDLGESKFDLTLFANEGRETLELAVEYRADRFDGVWMKALLDHYETLLERLPKRVDGVVAEVSMLGERPRAWLREAAGGKEPGVKLSLLPAEIFDRARRSADTLAVVCNGERWSHGELAARTGAVERALVGAGVGPGDRVGLFLERSAAMIAGILGIHRAGAAYVPLDPGYPRARNQQVLEDAEVAAVLTTAALRDGLGSGPWAVLEVDRLDDVEPVAAAPSAAPPDAAAYILYTSGSTGRPKGVVVTHDNLRASTVARLEVYQQPPRRFLLLPSVAFDSSVAGVFWTLATAGTLVIPTADEIGDPRLLARLVEAERVTSLLCVPSLYAQLLTVGGSRLRGLESAIVAGESCPQDLVAEHLRRLPRVRLFNEYGPTEATVWATMHEITARDAARPVAIGRPIPGVRVEVLDRRGRPVPPGVAGEVWICGPTVALGYWRRPGLTAAGFRPDDVGSGRRYRTGDRAAWAADGRLLFLGRQDDQIKLRGFRIEPGEIEAALRELPGVEEAAVVARPPGGVGEAAGEAVPTVLVAFIEGSDRGGGWRQALGERLPGHMIPGRLVELPELPRLPNGKIDRRGLRRMSLEPEAASAPAGPPPNDRERELIALWEGLLGISGIGVDDNFFELGGHSLLAFEMSMAIERDLGARLSPAEVFASPTVRELARRVERRGGGGAPVYRHLYPIQPAGRGAPLVFALPHFFTEMLASRFRNERPVYGLRGVGLRPEGNLGRWRTMRQLGEELADEIERRFPGERCFVAGYSFGASMAFEATRIMEERGRPPRGLYLIAPMPLDIFRLGPFRLQLDALRQPIAQLGKGDALRRYARQNSPLTRAPYRRIRRRLVIEPWRRLLCAVGRLRILAGLPLTPRIQYADVRVDRFRLHARYRPGIVRTPTVLFNASEPATDAAATWRPHFRGPIVIQPIPDPHLDDGDSLDAARALLLDRLRDLEDGAC
jgi:amino acid adenylation domain-containing protein